MGSLREWSSRGAAFAALASIVLALVGPPPLAAEPAGQLAGEVTVVIEEPRDGETVAGDVIVRGWAVDTRAAQGSGIRTSPGGLQIWMDRRAGSATGQLVGDAAYGIDRADLAGARGERFRGAGFALTWNTCLVPEGRHSLQAFAESAGTGAGEFGFAQVDVVVGTCPAAARPSEVIGGQPLRVDPSWQAILQRVSELRGLAPIAEIYRAPLTAESYARRFDADFARYYQSQDVDTGRLLLIAFGLLDPGYSLVTALQSFYTGAPLGLYDVDTGTLFVSRDPPDSPLARVTMAHELTHALQDQHYDMQTLLPSSTGLDAGAQAAMPADGQTAVRALVEGDAVLVQNMYQATTIQDPAELASLEQEEAAARAAVDFDSLPYVVFQTTYFPYLYGPGFIHAVLGDGPLTTYGQYGPAIDRVFRRPPTSTSQILHPERYRDGVDPVPVSLPDLSASLGDEWVPLGEGLLGEFDHRLILDNFLRATDPERAARASSGWMGDRTAVFRHRDPDGAPLGDLAVVLKTRWATPDDVQAWAQAYGDSVALRFADPVRYAGREDQLVPYSLGTNRLGWVMPGERAIVLAWTRQHSAIVIAPDLTLAHALAEQALAGD